MCHLVDAGAGKEHYTDWKFSSVKNAFWAFDSAGTAELDSPLAAQLQGFFCALADEVAFDFGAQAKGKGQNLALNVVTQPVIVFYGPHPHFLFHEQIQYGHDHKKAAAKAGKL